MRAQGLTGSFWPTGRQKLVLRAAVCGGAESIRAWRLLRASLDLDTLEPASSALLPQVHRQLTDAGYDDPLLPRLQGMYRRTWYLNHLRLDGLAPALTAVRQSGADPLVVAGWELPARYYRDLGVRAVADLRLLVRPEHLATAERALSRFSGPQGEECFVSSRLFPDFPTGLEPTELWDAAVELELPGVTALALGPTDELLSVCLRGARMQLWPSLVWLADAMAILGAAGREIDWARLVEHAGRLRASLRLRDALLFLLTELDAPVPRGTLEELDRVPVSRREVLAHRAAGVRWPLVGAVPDSVPSFLRATADRNVLVALARLPAFLRDEWTLERSSQVPLEAARKGAARIRVHRRGR